MILAFIAVLLTYLIMDGIWLGLVSKAEYQESIGGLMREKVIMWPWVVFYIIYSAALAFIIIKPNVGLDNFSTVAISGILFGAAAYGAYNLTNYAILKDWPLGITIKDWTWGVFVTTSATLSGWYVVSKFGN